MVQPNFKYKNIFKVLSKSHSILNFTPRKFSKIIIRNLQMNLYNNIYQSFCFNTKKNKQLNANNKRFLNQLLSINLE